ncbi:MAG: HAD family acid phosphatase [Sphingomonas sp.]
MIGGRAAPLALLLAIPALSGCVAVLPLAAAGTVAKQQIDHGRARKPGKGWQITTATALPPPSPQPVAPAPAAPQGPPAGMQYLYGSGEAAALSTQAYQGLWNYLTARIADRKAGVGLWSVVMSPEATLAVPKFMACGKKPIAAVFDIDETVLLNLGYEYSDAKRTGAYDESRWKRWEQTGADKVAAVPGAAETLEAARRAGVTIVFNSNRSESSAAQTIAALGSAGLGPAELGKTLWLRADGAPGGKDARRWEISAKYCVVALVGDQLGDFSDLFNVAGVSAPVRRNTAVQTMIAPMWGSGWFLLPNPVYGTALRGDLDELFPADKRWTDPEEK